MQPCAALLFVQINDFYHIDYLLDPADKTSMVLPRLATILTRLRKLEEEKMLARVMFCLPGDFLNPSCLSRHFHSRQMVDLLNAIGLDYVTFGNHEFDFDMKPGFTPEKLLQRIRQSEFEWIGSNFDFSDEKSARLFESHPKFVDLCKIDFGDHGIVMFGLLYEAEFEPFGRAVDPILKCQSLIDQVKRDYPNQHLSFIALTHQSLEEDKRLADACPALGLIMGGHDHDIALQCRQNGALIVKTKSNARTIRLNWVVAVSKQEFEQITSSLQKLQPHGTEDPSKTFVVSQFIFPALWLTMTGSIAFHRDHPLFEQFQQYATNKGFVEGIKILRKRFGDDYVFMFSAALDSAMSDFKKLIPEQANVRGKIDDWVKEYPSASTVIITAPCQLVVADEEVRRRSTNFGNFVADIVRGKESANKRLRPPADVALVNGGSFRLGRNVIEGEPITRRLLCDILFHSNDIREYLLTGHMIQDIVKQSLRLRRKGNVEGHGDFLQVSGIEVNALASAQPEILFIREDGDPEPLRLDGQYSVAVTRYVAEGSKHYRSFFESGLFQGVVEKSIRDAVERELKCAKEFNPDPANRWILPGEGDSGQ